MDGTENKLVATDRAILTTGSLKVIRVFNIESVVKKGKRFITTTVLLSFVAVDQTHLLHSAITPRA